MFLLTILLSGCRTGGGEDSVVKDVGLPAQWHRIMTCNGGDAVVDVDLNERRNFQIVLKNKLGFPRFDSDVWAHNRIANADERIYRGYAIDGKGVFHGPQFVGFFANAINADAAGRIPGFKLKRSLEHSDHGPDFERLTFTAVNLAPCAGELRDNDFPPSCRVDEMVWSTCQLVD